MKKIAFVVQRYGVEVNGGAEYLCRILAERLVDTYEVDVLTSCALEYVTWANWYPAEETDINGVHVHRFATPHNRLHQETNYARRRLRRWARVAYWKHLSWLKAWPPRFIIKNVERYGQLWARYHGPYTTDLITYLEQHQQEYEALIFITYLYYPTIAGLNVAPHKSIFIPTAHDEKPIYSPLFRRLFQKPRGILFLTQAEREFVHRQFKNKAIYNDILGIGIEANPDVPAQLGTDLIGTDTSYLIYMGRIDTAKGCDVLFDYFVRYKSRNPSSLKLVLVGQAFMNIPKYRDIIAAGFVEEDVKASLLKGAKALTIFSLYESLSMVTLESFAYGIPVIANQKCHVIKDHIDSSQAGLLFDDYTGFERAVNQILSQDNQRMAQHGRDYIERYYTWDKVLATFDKAVDYISAENS